MCFNKNVRTPDALKIRCNIKSRALLSISKLYALVKWTLEATFSISFNLLVRFVLVYFFYYGSEVLTIVLTVVSSINGKRCRLCPPLNHHIKTASEMKVIVFLLLLYCTLFSFDQIKMISLFYPCFGSEIVCCYFIPLWFIIAFLF